MSLIVRPQPDREPFAGLPKRHYGFVFADPNWTYEAYSGDGGQKSAAAHYDVSSVADIAALPVADLCAPDCHLMLCTTWPNIFQAQDVAEGWGFRYSGSGFVWVKTRHPGNVVDLSTDIHMGLGHTTRKNTEPVLLFRRGNPRRKSKSVRELVFGPEVVWEDGDLEDWPSLWAPRGRHSAKPDAMFRRCEAYGDGPYLELYSRRTQPGWDAWGAEAGRFDDGQLARPAKVLGAEGLPLFGRVA